MGQGTVRKALALKPAALPENEPKHHSAGPCPSPLPPNPSRPCQGVLHRHVTVATPVRIFGLDLVFHVTKPRILAQNSFHGLGNVLIAVLAFGQSATLQVSPAPRLLQPASAPGQRPGLLKQGQRPGLLKHSYVDLP